MAQANNKSVLSRTLQDTSGAGKEKIGKILCKEGIITTDLLDEALTYMSRGPSPGQSSAHQHKLSTILIKLGHIENDTVYNILTRSYNFRGIRLSNLKIDNKLLGRIPFDKVKPFMAFPVSEKDGILTVGMVEPTNTEDIDKLQYEVKLQIDPRVVTEPELIEAYKKHYRIKPEDASVFTKPLKVDDFGEEEVTQVEDFGSIISEASSNFELQATDEMSDDTGQQMNADAGPIIKLVDGILVKAVNEGVSDIHIEPMEKVLQIRYRKDGNLYKSMNLPSNIKSAVVSRVKILSRLKIEEKRIPQDGRIKMKLGRKQIDFRVSTLPVIFGEKIVLRILDQSNLKIDMTGLGFTDRQFSAFKRNIERPFGMILVTGPTGSGKTVTLYSALNHLNNEKTNIMTAEKPVEFNIKGLNQVNIDTNVGLTFPTALKAFLRQDPNVIMVGEMRDLEEASIGVEASQTGHLVLSTLHTNDAPGSISRLVDMGVPPYIVTATVSIVVAQRLVRRLCQNCKKPYKSVPAMLLSLGFTEEEAKDAKLFRPGGCEKCNGIGYKGRVGLFELMEMTEDIIKAVNASVTEDQIRKIAIRNGMLTLRRSGVLQILAGTTSVEEVVKETVLHKETLPKFLANPDIEEYGEGEIIIHEGNKDKDFFQLERGAVGVFKGKKKIATITERGEHFGELAALTGEKRSASIVAMGKTVVKRFPGDKMDEVLAKHPEISIKLFRVLADRLSNSTNSMGQAAAN
ncbi:MAG: Flp pilus assembly complex ATPase component TadA [Desulfobacteraceae bacterium]|nr:Flp pilus assembly complex ATPase component TadA [Desulfobacteraceae bacterium]